jgi:8-oxo-dGTP pyrophosphatase MutT (NUDIX family)
MKILDPVAAAAVVPRAASTTLVVRDGAAGLEVLMVKRSPNASFMPGAYVFPGGAVDAADATVPTDESADALQRRIGAVTGVGALALAYAVAALRECEEECNLRLGADVAAPPLYATSVLQPWSHWVTPFGLPKRFDTLFFVAPCPPDQVPKVDEGETTTLAWVHPPAALADHAGGGFQMEFATVRTVESLVPYGSAGALLAEAASRRHLPPLHPRVKVDAQGRLAGVLLPGQPGYDEAAPPSGA